MATKNYVLDGPDSETVTPYVLGKSRLIEASCAEWQATKTAVPYERPLCMTRAAVRKALLGPKDFRFTYRRLPNGAAPPTGSRTSVAIRFGCTTFKGENYRRLRKWALAK